MLAAVEKGGAKKVAELIRQDPGFDVKKLDGLGGGPPYCTSLARITVDPP